jgi:predicted phage terminase large subunit-like protein
MKISSITPAKARASMARLSFRFFVELAFHELGGEGAYQHNWHIDAIIYELERIRTGQNRRLIVTVPPRSLKTMIVSICWMAWMLGHNPALRFIMVSYGLDLAEKQARDCLRIIDSAWFRAAFPELHIAKRAVLDFETSAGGGRLSTSLGGPLTGRGADHIVVDDPIKADDSGSELARATAANWLSNTLMSRLNNKATGSISMIMQRLHEADPAGELISRGGWHELCLPAIATCDERIQIGANRFYMRREGFALHPARLPLSVLAEIRAQDSRVFAAQYQQAPVPLMGNFVNPAWFGYYDNPPEGGICVQSWDTASKTGVDNDFSVAITACYYQGRYYILDVFRRKVDFTGLRSNLTRLCQLYRVDRLLIEDQSSGQQLIQILRKSPPPGVPRPIPCGTAQDKNTRFYAQASAIEAGEVVLPRIAPWLGDFLTEIAGFPNARFDDQADALAQLLAHWPQRESTGLAAPRIGYH